MNALKAIPLLLLLPALMLMVSACGGASETTLVAPTATPAIEATIEAKVKTVLTAVPTATSTPRPVPTATPGPTATPVPTDTPTPPVPTAKLEPTPTPSPTATPVPAFLPMTMEWEAVVVPVDEEQAIALSSPEHLPLTLVYFLVAVTNPNDYLGGFYFRLRAIDEEGIKYDLRDHVTGHMSPRFQILVSPNSKSIHFEYPVLIRGGWGQPVPHEWVLEQYDPDSEDADPWVHQRYSGQRFIDPMENEFFTFEDVADDGYRWVVNKTDSDLTIGRECEHVAILGHYVLSPDTWAMVSLPRGVMADLIPTFQKFPDVTHQIWTSENRFNVEPNTKRRVSDRSAWGESLDDVIVNCHSWWVSSQ